jgi:hypothetical protein
MKPIESLMLCIPATWLHRAAQSGHEQWSHEKRRPIGVQIMFGAFGVSPIVEIATSVYTPQANADPNTNPTPRPLGGPPQRRCGKAYNMDARQLL